MTDMEKLRDEVARLNDLLQDSGGHGTLTWMQLTALRMLEVRKRINAVLNDGPVDRHPDSW